MVRWCLWGWGGGEWVWDGHANSDIADSMFVSNTGGNMFVSTTGTKQRA